MIHFSPKEEYEKYLKLLVSLMTMTLLVFPVLELVKSDFVYRFKEELNEYEVQMEQLMENTPVYGVMDENTYLSTISNEIKTRINNLEEETGYSIKSLEIQGISSTDEKSGTQEGKLKIIVMPRNVGISTTRVDKIKCSGNPDKSTKTAAQIEEEAKLCQIYAKELGVMETDLEVLIDGMEKDAVSRKN
ncbi:MAG: hypothetical protein GX234_10740 [Clostridiales bacterium]|nr:hypothetical protein [Clostridiales bacterium]